MAIALKAAKDADKATLVGHDGRYGLIDAFVQGDISPQQYADLTRKAVDGRGSGWRWPARILHRT